jgi:zinc D-Ala-D-Ala carboxypeptidase
VGGHPGHVSSRVGGRGRHRAFDATAWLSEHGAEHGLCQIYGNEPWHYELRPEAVHDGCPPMYGDPTQDPRLQR